MQYEHKEVDFWRYCEKRKHYGVEDIKDSCAEKKYTIDTRKKIYRGFAKRCKKVIEKRMKKSHYGAYLLDIASLYPVPLLYTKAVIASGDFKK